MKSRTHTRIAQLFEWCVALAAAEQIRDQKVAMAVGGPQAAVRVAVADVTGTGGYYKKIIIMLLK